MIQTPPFNGPTGRRRRRTVNRNLVQGASEGGPRKVNLGVILFPDLIKGILKVPQPAHFRVFESGTTYIRFLARHPASRVLARSSIAPGATLARVFSPSEATRRARSLHPSFTKVSQVVLPLAYPGGGHQSAFWAIITRPCAVCTDHCKISIGSGETFLRDLFE